MPGAGGQVPDESLVRTHTHTHAYTHTCIHTHTHTHTPHHTTPHHTTPHTGVPVLGTRGRAPDESPVRAHTHTHTHTHRYDTLKLLLIHICPLTRDRLQTLVHKDMYRYISITFPMPVMVVNFMSNTADFASILMKGPCWEIVLRNLQGLISQTNFVQFH